MPDSTRERPELTVVANRLPVEQTPDGWAVSPGGLVTALRPVLSEVGGRWLGWPGTPEPVTEGFDVDGLRLEPLHLEPDDLELYYEGFANGTLWPLYHDKIHVPEFHRTWWRRYVEVNRQFARRAAEIAPEDSAVWIHDYHLSLVPGILRGLRPDLKLGYFLHIPFPPMELFAQLPWRRELLMGMLGADSVGFQTTYGARNFRAVSRRYAGLRTQGSSVYDGDREVIAEAFPISIDARDFATGAASDVVGRKASELRSSLGGRRILLGVDRLDYTKGIELRLRAYETLLDRRPEVAQETVFIQIVVPSRENVPGYGEMRDAIERIAGRINGKHSAQGLVPVYYHYTSLERDDLLAHYRAADVMVVTPPRDGMNLVSKEYCACQVELAGALVLSEFAGAALELTEAYLVNPYDLDGMADTIDAALRADPAERRRRMAAMRQTVMTHDVHRWAETSLRAFDAFD